MKIITQIDPEAALRSFDAAVEVARHYVALGHAVRIEPCPFNPNSYEGGSVSPKYYAQPDCDQ